MTIYEPWSVVDVPFPFIDKDFSKRRKALVVSSESYGRDTGATILVMITSAENSTWKSDVAIEKYSEAGLRKPCVVRFKVFSIDSSLILGRVGVLQEEDRKRVKPALRAILGTL